MGQTMLGAFLRDESSGRVLPNSWRRCAGKARWVAAVLVIGSLLAQPSAAWANSKVYVIQVGDTHDRTQDHHYQREAALIESLRTKYGADHCLLVHSGDIVSKGNLFSAKTQGAGNMAYWNKLGLDVWTLGNGDLYGKGDYSYYDSFPSAVENATTNVSLFDGDALATNYYKRDSQNLMIPGTLASTVKTVKTTDGGNVKIGLFGLTTQHVGKSSDMAGHYARDYNKQARDAVSSLINGSHADVVIPVTHLGYGTAKYPVDSWIMNDVAGFPALLGGHDHIPLTKSESRDRKAKSYFPTTSKYYYPTTVYGNTGYAFDDNEKESYAGAMVGYAAGVLELTLDKNKKVIATKYTFYNLPAYDAGDPVQQEYETFLTEWIEANSTKYANPDYGGNLVYSDLDTPWPAHVLEAEETTDVPPLTIPAPVYIRGETRTVTEVEWGEWDQTVFIGQAGKVVVTGSTAAWDHSDSHLGIGDEGHGTLEVKGGAYVAANTAAIGGTENTTDPTADVGEVIVHNGWLNVLDRLDVGYYGRGTLRVGGEGVVTAMSSYLGFAPGSIGEAIVENASYWDTGDVWIGYHGTGRVWVTSGSLLQSGNAVVGAETDGVGDVLVIGAGSLWCVGDPIFDDADPVDLTIGQTGQGRLLLADGGQAFVQGDMTIGSHGQLAWIINEHTQPISMTVLGQATLAGALSVTVTEPTRSQYVLLESTELSNAATSATINENLLLLDFRLAFESTPGQIRLESIISPQHRLVNYAADGNAATVAGALDRTLAQKVQTTGGAPFGDLLSRLVAISSPESMTTAVNSLVPQTAAVPGQVAVNGAYWFGQYAIQQTQSRRSGAGSLLGQSFGQLGGNLQQMLAASESDAGVLTAVARKIDRMPLQAADRDSSGSSIFYTCDRSRSGDDWIWATTYGSYADQKPGEMRPGFSYQSTGFLLGMEADRSSDVSLGLAFAYDFSQFAVHGGQGRGEMNTFRYGPYLSCQSDSGLYFDTIVSGGLHWSDVTRYSVYGDMDSSPFDPDVSWTAELGRHIQLEQFRLTPLMGLVFTNVFQNAYEESNPSAGAMQLWGDDIASLRSILGARFARPGQMVRRPVLWELQAGWTHEYLDNDVIFQGSFVEYSDLFQLSFAGGDRDAAYFGLGVGSQIRQGTTLSLKYLGLVGDSTQSHTGLLNLSFDF